VVFFALARGGSEIEIPNVFRAKQGGDTPIADTKNEAVNPTLTIVGSIKLNNRNATAEEVKKVYIKGNTLAGRTTLSGNRFVLEEVEIPKSKIIEIAVDLKDVPTSPSELFKVPKADKDNISDLGEVLIEYKQANKNSRKSGGAGKNVPFIVINNSNIINK
jgi:hypothetical protein